MDDHRLVKTVRFKTATYVGDPVNAVKIFNQKEVDELILLDIGIHRSKAQLSLEMIRAVCDECFMPLCYGGGVVTANQALRILGLGVEKIAFNTAAVESPQEIREAARISGSQSVVISIDVRRRFFGRAEVVIRGGTKSTGITPVDHARRAVDLGAGELLVTAVDRDGTWSGYDIELIQSIASSVNIPVIANGGAGSIADIALAVLQGGASAAAIGSLAVYSGPDQGVLIRFPPPQDLAKALRSR